MIWTILTKLKPIGAPILENYLRLKDRVKLASLKIRGKSTVKTLINPEALTSDKVVIFVAYPAGPIASMHIRLLNRFQKIGYSVLFVSNHANPQYVFASCLDQRWVFLFRHPFGRDFGAFKDATLYLHKITQDTGNQFRKIVYINDSVATIDRDEPALIAHLDKEEADFSGITENYDKGLHVGSFVMSVGQRAFYHKRIIRYWQKFQSLSTRRYAIGRGELGFSKAMRRAGFVPDVLWTLARMKLALLQKSTSELLQIAEAMEPHFRRQIDSPMNIIDARVVRFLGRDNIGLPNDSVVDKILDKLQNKKKKIRPMAAGPALMAAMVAQATPQSQNQDSREFRFVRYRENFMGLSRSWQSSQAAELGREDLVNLLLLHIFRGSQIHHGAAPLLFVGAGLIKKDVVLRRIVEPFDIDVLLERTGVTTEERVEISRDILAKGHPYSMRGWAKLLNDWDFT